MEGMSMRLISGRTAVQGQNLDSKLTDEYFNEAAVCRMNERDMEKLGVAPEEHVKVTTPYGAVVVKAKKDDGNPEGLIFITMGPWANAVVSGNTHGAGMPSFKGIDATIEKTGEPVLRVKELMHTYMG
jgi:formylmethanofuran dehydrogenase subunit D